MTDSKLNYALNHAAAGFFIFPLDDNGKKPRRGFTKWEAQATTDPDQIKKWWGKWPAANIAIAAGKSGLIVIDVDPDAGGDIELLPLATAEKVTVIQETGGGGRHYFYRQPQGVQFGNANKMPAGIDSRGDGGYIVAPGSIHPETGEFYRWAAGHSPAELQPLPLPYALGALLKPKGGSDAPDRQQTPAKAAPVAGGGDNPAYVESAFTAELAALAGAPNGDRNEQLNRAAFTLGQFVGAAALSRAEVENALQTTAEALGLGATEAQKTINSGITAGMEDPRKIPAGALYNIGDIGTAIVLDREQFTPRPITKMFYDQGQWGYYFEGIRTSYPEDQVILKNNTNGTGPATVATALTQNKQAPPDGIGQKPPQEKFRLTDLGNAKRLVSLFGENIRFVPAWGKWFIWDGSRWEDDELKEVERLAKKVPLAIYREALNAGDDLRPKIAKWGAASESAGKISAMIALAQSEKGIAIRHKDLDSLGYLLNCNNGTIDLQAGELLPHNRDHLITKKIDVDYDPAATCPLWLKFLDRVMGGDQELVNFLQRAVGYTLTGDVTEQTLFFMFGSGKNGKSVFSETLKALFADYGQKAPTDMLMMKYNQGVPNDVARLPGARFVLAAEVEEGRRLAESQVKDLTGGDTIVARFMRQEFFEFEPTHKIWMYGNHKPDVKGTDDGIWRRIKLIPFTVTIPPEEQDPYLTKKLKGELAGILNWAVKGCLDWQANGLQIPAIVANATDAYRAEMDALSEFLDDCCIEDEFAQVKASDLHNAYQDWCANNNERPLPRRKFGNRLRERGFVSDKLSTHIYWLELGLKAE